MNELEKKIKKLKDWIRKNSTIPFKDIFRNKLESKLRLVSMDGGWVNAIELNKKIDEVFNYYEIQKSK